MKAKIVGITTVNIPSPMHPIIPYNVLLLEDEHGNRIPKKTMKDYSIGDMYEISPAKTDGAVVLTKIKYDIEEYLKETINLIGTEFSAQDKILIKPSIIEPAYGYQAVTTNPYVVDALINVLRDKGVTDIVVAEQSMIGNDTVAGAKKSGILAVCEKHSVPFLDLSKSEFVHRDVDGFSFNIAKEVLERKVINLPVLKTHSQISIAGAMENLSRVVDVKTHVAMYAHDINKTLPSLLKAARPFLSIGDASIGMQGNGPTLLGEPSFMNMFFASRDAVALDAVFAEIGMLKVPEYIHEAHQLNIGNSSIKEIEIVGEDLRACVSQLKEASHATWHPNIFLIDGKAHSGIFNAVLKGSQKLFGVRGHKMYVAIGKHISRDMVADKTRIVAIGADAIQVLKELKVSVIAEISEDSDPVETVMLMKSILEDPEKSSIGASDKVKSKLASLGMKLKKTLQ